MKVLYAVPSQPGDIVDDDHFRVEHHHEHGLYNDSVLIVVQCRSGQLVVHGPRTVRSCSRIDGRKEYSATILVHLKPKAKTELPRLHCRDIDTIQFLRTISKRDRVPTIPEILFDNPDMNQTPCQRLIFRKFQKLWHKGYVDGDDTRVRLTAKGRQLLEATRD